MYGCGAQEVQAIPGVVMEFDKISEQNTWNAVEEETRAMRSGEGPDEALAEWFRQQGIEIESAVFPCIGKFDEGMYSGTLVTQDRRVLEYFVDLSDPDESELEDVTENLGPKDPAHPESDICDRITMALVYYDAKQGQAA